MPLIGTADKFRKMGDLFWPLVIVLLLIELLGLSFTIHIIYTFVFLFWNALWLTIFSAPALSDRVYDVDHMFEINKLLL